jgi:hypothetical protein
MRPRRRHCWASNSNRPATDTAVELVLLGLGVRRAMQAAPVWEYVLNDHYCLRVVADQTRLKIEPTCTAVHRPPRAVATPRAFSDRAMPRCDATPLDWISRIIGATFLAKRLASAFTLATQSASIRSPMSFGRKSDSGRRAEVARAL